MPPRASSTAMFDRFYFVRQNGLMITNTREFLRQFAAFKAKARRGETVRIRDKEGDFVFAISSPRRSLIGAARGKIAIHGDLTGPTLAAEAWKPSL